MSAITSVCVYCGSSPGNNPMYSHAAATIGRLIAERGLRMVYGGGAVGLMGIAADAAMKAGGTVTGIIPENLFPREVAHQSLTELIHVPNMHVRKAEMFSAADAFIALPGGFGTLEELAEVLTWAQIGVHDNPVGLLNTGGFYDPLLAWVDQAVDHGFAKPANRDLLLVADKPSELLDALAAHAPTLEPKWTEL